ncbi:MAG: winged helix-turn-helix transcriptional regulator [Alphaproteobacteria bacterium]|nr:winged helix-turn-helix transcriptional regulator [Alphaproteobacteria bacterium]
MAGDGSQHETMDAESEITLGLLTAVHENSGITQRSAAKELGIALGLTNAYLKRCVRKGYIKVSQIPSNRYAYYLTPQGFSEKARLTAEYLSSSLTFFRQARSQCAEALQHCRAQGLRRIALAGAGDLAEIATLCARDIEVQLVGTIDPGESGSQLAGLPVANDLSAFGTVDAVLVTDLKAPQETYERLRAILPAERILTPALLHIVRGAPADGAGPP